jgi:predicted nucleic acid-binding protein
MAFLIAADVLVQAERGKFDLDAWLRVHADDEIKIAAITVAELWRSVERATGLSHAKREKFLERALEVFEVVPYSEKAAVVHARLWSVLDATGQKTAMQDQILAATAIEQGATLVTFHARRFAAMAGLAVVAP